MKERLDISECHKRRCTVSSGRRLITNQVSYRLSIEHFTFACVQKTTNSLFTFPKDLRLALRSSIKTESTRSSSNKWTKI